MDIANGAIGPETKWDISNSGGKCIISVTNAGADGGFSFSGYINEIQLLELVKKAFPNAVITGLVDGAEAILES